MKVLVISERWWPDGTGGILASHLIAKILRDAGFKLIIVHGTREPVKLKGVNYIYTDLLSVRNKQRLWFNCLALVKRNWFLELVRGSDVVYIPRYCYPLIPIAKKLGKKVVAHLHDYQPLSYNAVVLKRGDELAPRSLRDVVMLEALEHGDILRVLGGASAPLNKLCRFWLREADVIICVSKKQDEIIKVLAPELTCKLEVIYNPLPDVPLTEKKPEEPTFLYLGGDSYFKGFHVFLGASREMLKRGPSVKFLVTGFFRRKDSKFIINMLNSRFNNVFHALGFIPYDGVLRLHSRSYAILFPSIWEEPLPYTIIESMLAGTIPIASRVGGVPEIVEGTFAERLLCMPNDAVELAERMKYIVSMNREQLMDIGLSLRESALKKFDEEPIRMNLRKYLM